MDMREQPPDAVVQITVKVKTKGTNMHAFGGVGEQDDLWYFVRRWEKESRAKGIEGYCCITAAFVLVEKMS